MPPIASERSPYFDCNVGRSGDKGGSGMSEDDVVDPVRMSLDLASERRFLGSPWGGGARNNAAYGFYRPCAENAIAAGGVAGSRLKSGKV